MNERDDAVRLALASAELAALIVELLHVRGLHTPAVEARVAAIRTRFAEITDEWSDDEELTRMIEQLQGQDIDPHEGLRAILGALGVIDR